MQKQLMQQISKAMRANADTIVRQKDVINYQEQVIERLRRLLTDLAETQEKELKALPTMFEKLEKSLNESTKEQKAWQTHQKSYVEGQITLAEQLITLTTSQNQLATVLSEYQDMLVPDNTLSSDVESLETNMSTLKAMLKSTSDQLKKSQSVIQKSQQQMISELEKFEVLTKE